MTSSSSRNQNVIRAGCAAVLMCFAAASAAQEIFRQVDEAGRLTFTDRPGADVPAVVQRKAGMSVRRAAQVDEAEAARRLGDARLQRARGERALPGERDRGADLGPVNGRYWKRQEGLRRDVELALVRWNETRGQFQAAR